MRIPVLRASRAVGAAGVVILGGLAGSGAAADASPAGVARLVTAGQPGAAIAGSRLTVTAVTTDATVSAGAWGNAIEVPGTASLNVGGNARVVSMSCPTRGYCAAGGSYGAAAGDRIITQAFVVSRRHGRWGRALKVPGLAKLPAIASGIAQVSCASAGNCAAGGVYVDNAGDNHAFVVSERDGNWGNALQVAGALNAAGNAGVGSVSCPSAGNCDAAGHYGGPGISNTQAFVVRQRNGRWGNAFEVPGTAALNSDKAGVSSISCPSAGNCSAGGGYVDAGGLAQAFVASQRDGLWSPAIEVPGLAVLNGGGDALVTSMSCPSAGNCAAGGYYESADSHWHAFVVSQRRGTWGTAAKVVGTDSVPGPAPVGPAAAVNSVSCPAVGNCAAAGYYTDGSGRVQAFVAGQRNGRWGKKIEVPGTAALNRRGRAAVLSVSCPSAGSCAAAGYYTDGHGHFQAFVAGQRNGRWRTAIEVPGTAALNAGGSAALTSVSCPAAGRCSAGGTYKGHSGNLQAFVVSQKP